VNGKRIYSIAGGQCGRETLLAILREHPEIRFVSLVAIDLAGNDTDERIPIQTFVADIDAVSCRQGCGETDWIHPCPYRNDRVE